MEHSVNSTLAYLISLVCDVRQGDVPAAILAILIELDFQPCMDGFGYLRKAILLKHDYPDLRLCAIYDEIVKSFDSALYAKQVEQAMISAIESTWENRNKEKWDYFFSVEKMGKNTKPTNKEFISQLACFMELWSSHCKGGTLCK